MSRFTKLAWEVDNGPRAALFREFRNRKVLYYANHGNAGDSLIAAATYQLFDKNSIRWIPTKGNDVDGEVVIIGGGGNMVPLYKSTAAVVERCSKLAKLIVILPHTIRQQTEIFDRSSVPMYVFCRENTSYNELMDISPKIRPILGHDMALFVDAEQILESSQIKTASTALFSERLSKYSVDISAVESRNVDCFRGDKEGTKDEILENNFDISEIFKNGVHPRQANIASWMFLEFIRLANIIRTNRLHVGIASAVLEKPTELFDNSYGKNKDVYRHSLSGRYSSLKFVCKEKVKDST